MSLHRGKAIWEGNLMQGHGWMQVPTADLEAGYSAPSRFEGRDGASPEALIGAAHAGCYSMELASRLAKAGFAPSRLETDAELRLDRTGTGFVVTGITLRTRAEVPQVGEEEFATLALEAKDECPVSRLLNGVEVRLDLKLER